MELTSTVSCIRNTAFNVPSQGEAIQYLAELLFFRAELLKQDEQEAKEIAKVDGKMKFANKSGFKTKKNIDLYFKKCK